MNKGANIIRPKSFKDFIGQSKSIYNLKVFTESAKARGEPLDHTIFFGPPGLGKTTLAKVLAEEMDADIVVTSGPALENREMLANMVKELKPHSILFIDEVHRLHPQVEELIYPAIEDYQIDMKQFGGNRIELAKFTLVGATTRLGLLTKPLRERFEIHIKLEYYSSEELYHIIKRAANIHEISITNAANVIADRARGTPRIAERILRRARDFALACGEKEITTDIAIHTCKSLGLDHKGLDDLDRAFLNCLIDNFQGGPAGINAVAASLGEDLKTLQDVCEPYLLQNGFLSRTEKGRVVTRKAYEHLNKDSERAIKF